MKSANTFIVFPAVLLAALCSAPLAAQESFGLGAGAEAGKAGGTSASGAAVLSGELRASALAFYGDLDEPDSVFLGDLASALLDVDASGSKVDAALRLKLTRGILAEAPERAVDEAFLRLRAGNAVVEAGIMKLSWGKADSQGPLDVVNPVDLSDLSITDGLERKIARPMLHAALGLGPLTKLEAVFLPGFEGHRIATAGHWKPAAIDDLDGLLSAGGAGTTYADLEGDYSSLRDYQAGCRFTTSSGSVDWGVQYFYGLLPRPAVVFTPPFTFSVSHERYHQAGADFAVVVAGLNLRAEMAANVTEDLAGDDPAIRNPCLPFSLGFDRELFAGVSLNVQYAGSVRLKDDTVSSPYDVEAGSDALSTRVTAVLSQSLFKDLVAWEITSLWGVEDADWLVKPSLAYRIGDAEVEVAAGLFGGDSEGELGQYRDSSYLSVGMKYAF